MNNVYWNWNHWSSLLVLMLTAAEKKIIILKKLSTTLTVCTSLIYEGEEVDKYTLSKFFLSTG